MMILTLKRHYVSDWSRGIVIRPVTVCDTSIVNHNFWLQWSHYVLRSRLNHPLISLGQMALYGTQCWCAIKFQFLTLWGLVKDKACHTPPRNCAINIKPRNLRFPGRYRLPIEHDDVMIWKRFPRYWSFVRTSTGHRCIPTAMGHKRGLWFFLWLRRYDAHMTSL